MFSHVYTYLVNCKSQTILKIYNRKNSRNMMERIGIDWNCSLLWKYILVLSALFARNAIKQKQKKQIILLWSLRTILLPWYYLTTKNLLQRLRKFVITHPSHNCSQQTFYKLQKNSKSKFYQNYSQINNTSWKRNQVCKILVNNWDIKNVLQKPQSSCWDHNDYVWLIKRNTKLHDKMQQTKWNMTVCSKLSS